MVHFQDLVAAFKTFLLQLFYLQQHQSILNLDSQPLIQVGLNSQDLLDSRLFKLQLIYFPSFQELNQMVLVNFFLLTVVLITFCSPSLIKLPVLVENSFQLQNQLAHLSHDQSRVEHRVVNLLLHKLDHVNLQLHLKGELSLSHLEFMEG